MFRQLDAHAATIKMLTFGPSMPRVQTMLREVKLIRLVRLGDPSTGECTLIKLL